MGNMHHEINRQKKMGKLIDRSPTATPFETRSGSPAHGNRMPHTLQESEAAMEKMRAFLGGVISTAGATKLAALDQQSTSMKQNENYEMETVGVVDGSNNVPIITKAKLLMVYFAFNLGLTLFNKAIMIKFPFPFLVTALHAIAGCLGTGILSFCGALKVRTLTKKESLTLYAFSLLYTVNIAVSNVSLSMVSIPFHQVLRAITPAFTVTIYRVYYSKNYRSDTYISLIPTIAGAGFATYGDYNATLLGFIMTLFGAILAAVKTVMTNRMQTAGLHLTAMELLYRMSPLALFQSLGMAFSTGEFSAFREFLFGPENMSKKMILVLLINAAMAFGLNVSSFNANKRAGALTMAVAANVKQILTVLLSVIFWHLQISFVNGLGIAMTLVGGAWYARVEVMGRTRMTMKHSRMARMDEINV